MQLVDKNDPVLLNPCKPFDFLMPPFEINDFARELVSFMYEKNGIGLAANQVGVPYRIFSMRAAPENFVCVNPKIVMFSNEKIVLEEGCLTYPNLLVKVKRSQHIRVRFETPNGDVLTKKFTGLSARIFQHEMDHLDGMIFYNRANKFHKDQSLRKWKKTI